MEFSKAEYDIAFAFVREWQQINEPHGTLSVYYRQMRTEMGSLDRIHPMWGFWQETGPKVMEAIKARRQ